MEQNARSYTLKLSLFRATLCLSLSAAVVLYQIHTAGAQPSAWGSKKVPTEQESGFDTFGFSKPQATPGPAATAVPSPEESEPAPDRVLRVIRQTQAATGATEQPEAGGQQRDRDIDRKPIAKRDTTAQLPKDPRFWQWASWYKEHGVLSLVVDGRDRAHLMEQLEKLAVLRAKKRVALGQVVIVGGGANLSESVISAPRNADAQLIDDPAELRKTLRITPTQFGDLCDSLNASPAPLINSSEILNHFNLTNSPAWIIRYQGRDYIFEGQTDISRLFTADGRFIR